MKVNFIIAFLLINLNLYSQKSSEYDYNTPLPPESYQFKKRFLNNVSLYTGQPSIDIPIYSINLDGMEVPISISYNTGGIKVEEEATSIGLGWSINIGGQITRTNHGAPDERFFVSQDYNNKSTFGIGRLKTAIDPNWSTPWSCNSYGEYGNRMQFYGKVFLAGNDVRNIYGNEDSRPDEFFYSFFGHSGKFMFSQELKKFITFPLDDININYDLGQGIRSNYFDNFSIQLPTGFRLVLGKDGTSSISQYGLTPFDQSWQLKKIISTKNNEISYNYISADYLLYTNLSNPVTQLITRSTREISSSSYESNITSTKEKLISEIIFPNGRINFVYGNRVDLQTGAKKLQEIKIYNNLNALIKRIEFVQSYFNANKNLFGKDAVDKRLRLDVVNFYDTNNLAVEKYAFDYYLLDKIPSKSSKAQDHWGYFNGKDSNTSLFPENLLPEHHVASNLGFNRDLDTLYTKTFSLKSIKFPEGGVKYYDYENHIALTGATTGNYYDAISDERYALKQPTFILSGYNLNYFYPTPNEVNSFNKVFYSEPIETSIYSSSLKSSEISILINSNLPFKVPNYSSVNAVFNKVEFYLESKQEDGTFKILKYLGTISKDENSTGKINSYFDVGGKGTYRMKTVVTQNYLLSSPNDYNFPHNTSFQVKYRDKIKDDVHFGGLRIKNIQTYTKDNLTGPKYTTLFKYLDDNNITSGKMMNVPSYVESISLGKPNCSIEGGFCFELGIRLSSSSVLSLYKTSGSNVGYTKVSQIDYDNTTKKEIKEDNYFSFQEPKFSEIPLFDDLREQEPKDWHRGKLLRKLSYNNNEIIKEELYNYYGEQLEKTMGYVDEINYELLDQNEMCTGTSYVSKHIFPAGVSFPNILKDIPQYPLTAFAYDGVYAANKYAIENYQGKLKIPYFIIYTGFDKLKSKITRNYLNGGTVEQTEEYIYNNTPTNIQLTSVRNSTSLSNDILETKYFYAQNPEMINEPYRNELLAKNMIALPLKEESYRGTNKLSEKATKYGSFSSPLSGQTLLLPQYIYTKKGDVIPNQLEKKVTYDKYDDKGNLQQYTLESGNSISLIWGYNKTLPIAKIENATNSQIATALGVTDISSLNETNLAAINALRNNVAFTNSMISTYSFIPLVGVSTITDPKGDTTTYTYDSFGRLEFVKDKNGNILSENQYHYKQ